MEGNTATVSTRRLDLAQRGHKPKFSSGSEEKDQKREFSRAKLSGRIPKGTWENRKTCIHWGRREKISLAEFLLQGLSTSLGLLTHYLSQLWDGHFHLHFIKERSHTKKLKIPVEGRLWLLYNSEFWEGFCYCCCCFPRRLKDFLNLSGSLRRMRGAKPCKVILEYYGNFYAFRL